MSERSSSQVDFTEWISNDPERKFIISRDKVLWNNVDRTLSIEVYKDYNENLFEDFECSFSVQFNEIENKSPTRRHMITLWKMGNRGGNNLIVYAAQVKDSNDKWNIVFHQRKNGKNLWVYSGKYQYDINKKYFFTVNRMVTNCRIIICEDDERANKIEDSGFKVGVADPYRFLSVAGGINVNVDRKDWSSGSIENLQITKLFSDSSKPPVRARDYSSESLITFNRAPPPSRPQTNHQEGSTMRELHNILEGRKFSILRRTKKYKKQKFKEIVIISVIIILLCGISYYYIPPIFSKLIEILTMASPVIVMYLFLVFIIGPLSDQEKASLKLIDAYNYLDKSIGDPELRKDAYDTLLKGVEVLDSMDRGDATFYSSRRELEKNFIENVKNRVAPALSLGEEENLNYLKSVILKIALIIMDENFSRMEALNTELIENFDDEIKIIDKKSYREKFYKFTNSKMGLIIISLSMGFGIVAIFAVIGSIISENIASQIKENLIILFGAAIALSVGIMSIFSAKS